MNAALERAHAAQQPRRFSLCTAEDIVQAIRELPGTQANLRLIVGATESMAQKLSAGSPDDEVMGGIWWKLLGAWETLDDCYVRSE